ncbi:hypothetical protein [Pseudomonas sp.]|uniref:hypothetical protein n=1 Tax=Pseudomonas sp. TaxID=306 RepID=UPI003C71789E
MFTTYRHAEILFAPVFGDHYQMWQFVEHNQHRPWFYVTVREMNDGLSWDTMVLIPNEDAFESILGAQSPDKQVASVALVIPARLNGSACWSMERLTELVRIHGQENQVLGYEFKTATGSVYLERYNASSAVESKTQIYLSTTAEIIA